jgi:quercetin dioxygenase-like cupin family protein
MNRSSVLVVTTLLLVTAPNASVTAAGEPPQAAAGVPGGCEEPAGRNVGRPGCFLVATTPLGALAGPSVYWHLYEYASRADAEAAVGPRGTAVTSLDRTWVYTIEAKDWQPRSGTRIGVVGPLQVSPGKRYTARYMEATFAPGMKTGAHRHSGAEAWYVVSGAQCLETPDGITVVKAGESGIVPQGPPMMLSTVGSETRRSVLIVLHESDQPWTWPVSDWQPPGRCPS